LSTPNRRSNGCAVKNRIRSFKNYISSSVSSPGVLRSGKKGVSMNTLNLALRFFLELAALAGFALLAWQSASGWWRFVIAVLVVIIAMALWGIFAVPNDPSRSGNAPVPVPGIVRLVLEFALLLGGAYAWYLGGFALIATVFTALVVFHYLLSIERIMWLLQQ
jgi:hypothetical protein